MGTKIEILADYRHWAILLSLLLIFTGVQAQERSDTAAFNPDLIILQLRRAADSTAADSSSTPQIRRITADSAKFVAPAIRSIITANDVICEIEPLLPVDSVKLFVRHSFNTYADTLGTVTSPPYRAQWDAADVPDQDQIHLQFGYILYVSDTLVITSPALPHRWVLKRGGVQPPAQKYTIAQISDFTEFSPDCDMLKWSRVKQADIEGGSYFKLIQSGSKLHFIAHIQDKSITNGDYVELHTDMRRDRADFSGINHRSLRFGPRSGFRSFTVELRDNGFAISDSVNAMLKENIEWNTIDVHGGYIIEAAIPLMTLSDVGWTTAKIGLDVSIMNVDIGKDTPTFGSWAKTQQFSRYNPSGWGTAGVSDAGTTIWSIILIFITLGILAPTIYVIHIMIKRKMQGKEDEQLDMIRDLMPTVVKDREEEVIRKEEDDDDDD